MTTLIRILKIIAAAGTVATGMVALIKPRSVYSFTGLRTENGRGITEIRAILGAFFIALGATALYFRLPETYLMLGITYLFVGIVRLISMFVDDSVVKSNIISVIVEVIFGIILILPV